MHAFHSLKNNSIHLYFLWNKYANKFSQSIDVWQIVLFFFLQILETLFLQLKTLLTFVYHYGPLSNNFKNNIWIQIPWHSIHTTVTFVSRMHEYSNYDIRAFEIRRIWIYCRHIVRVCQSFNIRTSFQTYYKSK